ncbi:hypothetical protein FOZ63_012594, partial [Perkinsus olseni]
MASNALHTSVEGPLYATGAPQETDEVDMASVAKNMVKSTVHQTLHEYIARIPGSPTETLFSSTGFSVTRIPERVSCGVQTKRSSPTRFTLAESLREEVKRLTEDRYVLVRRNDRYRGEVERLRERITGLERLLRRSRSPRRTEGEVVLERRGEMGCTSLQSLDYHARELEYKAKLARLERALAAERS